MNKILAFILLTLVSVTNAESIDSYCRSIVGESYSLMEVCINQETVARNEVSKKVTEPKIQNYCQNIVGDSYSLQETCINQEERAKQNISRIAVSNRVQNYCEGIVGDSYSLLEVCIQQEQGAKARIEPVVPTTKLHSSIFSNYGKSNIQKPSAKASAELIKDIQKHLNSLGYKAGTPDGVSGKKTKMAIKAFQKDNSLTIDGKHTYSLLSEIKMSVK